MKKNITEMALPTRSERKEFIEEQLRERVREWIEDIVNDELDQTLGIGWYERGEGRRGYRNGVRSRSFTTSSGKHTIDVPRGLYFEAGPDGKREWNSRLVPRYARRTEAVEDAVMKSYLCGINTRKVRHALAPLLRGAALSKSTVSRIVARLKEQFEAWRKRDLSKEDIAILFLDGFVLKIRLGGKVERIPVLCAMGVRASDGGRVLLALEIRTSESTAAWRAVTESLAARGVTKPVLAAIDGNDALHAAVKESWPWIEIQRCTAHKLENLYTHAPRRHYEQIEADYHAIVYAESEAEARKMYARFKDKWHKSCPEVVKSLDEAGDELLTFFRWPAEMWKMIRTTNCIERLNEEFRRRVKTQGSLPTTDAGVLLLFGLFACGIIYLRRIDGWKEIIPIVQVKRYEHGLIKTLDRAA